MELDLSNCATKADLKNATSIDTSEFSEKTDLANLKSDVNKFDIDKLNVLEVVVLLITYPIKYVF